METTFDIQEQRRNERLTAALAAAPAKTKQIAALRKKADALAAEAEATEAAELATYNERVALAQARAAATADLAELLQLQLSAATADEEGKRQVVRFLATNRGNDPYGKTNFLLGLDSIARLKTLAPILPSLIVEKQALIETLDAQIKSMGGQ